MDNEDYTKAIRAAQFHSTLVNRKVESLILLAEALEKNNLLIDAALIAEEGLKQDPYNATLLRIYKEGFEAFKKQNGQ